MRVNRRPRPPFPQPSACSTFGQLLWTVRYAAEPSSPRCLLTSSVGIPLVRRARPSVVLLGARKFVLDTRQALSFGEE